MKLIILGPDQKHEYQISWLEINTPHGNRIIQRGHVPMIVRLAAGKPFTFRLQSGKQETIKAPQGLVHIERTQITIVLATG